MDRPPQRSAARPFNYLEWLDKKARVLPPARDWLAPDSLNEPYGQFTLARYPSLRPTDRPLVEKIANRTWAEWVSKIAAREPSCLDELDADQKMQLAALVMETVKAIDDRKRQHLKVSLIRRLANEARRRNRALTRKLQMARKPIQSLRDYADDKPVSEDRTLHDARQILGRDYVSAADRALDSLQLGEAKEAIGFYESLKHKYFSAQRSEGYDMVRLYWFFRHACGLTGDESEIRVARLRNAFWTENRGAGC